MNNGYPEPIRRVGPSTSTATDIRVANDNRLGTVRRVGLDPKANRSALAIWQEKRFGRRAVVATATEFAPRILTPKFPLLKVLELGAIAYEIYNLTTGEVELPRDPTNPQDMAITFPDNWSHQYFDSGYQFTSDYYGWGPVPVDAQIWVPFSSGKIRCDPPPAQHQHEIYPGIDPFSIVEGAPHPRYKTFGRMEHRDLRSVNEFVVGDTHGLEPAEIHIKQNGLAAPDPFWTNAPRTVTETTIGIARRPITIAPRIRWAEIPFPRPGREVGNAPPSPLGPVADPVPPPTIIIPVVPPSAVGTAPGVTRPAPAPSPARPSPTRRPPGKGEKEKKVRIARGGIGAAIRVFEKIPEGLDLVNALWQELPKSCKTGYYKLHGKGGKVFYKRRFKANGKQRIADVYRCWTHIDAADAISAVVGNQIEDYFYGRIGRLAREAGIKNGWDRGLQFGPWDTGTPSDGYAQGAEEAKRRAEEEREAYLRGERYPQNPLDFTGWTRSIVDYLDPRG